MNNVISAVTARTHLAQILKLAGEGEERFLVDRGGEPAVIIMSIRDYIKNVAPPKASAKAIREDARRKGTSSLGMRDIDRIITTVRRQGTKKPKPTAR